MNNEYYISADKSKIDIPLVHDYLCNQSYWAAGITIDIVRKSIENSLCFGIYKGDQQVGFARVISDFATYAYLADVFVLEPERGKGLSLFLMQCIIDHPDLQGLRRFTLATRDAHTLYSKFGFTPLAKPDRWMERHQPDVYKKQALK
ncbi:MAG TPA: GNAT family N-acetyltransferase [Chitinophagaceae bacterium]|nr:GNAT family N-acetyltransferase [Chitinophagaceae bacterium]